MQDSEENVTTLTTVDPLHFIERKHVISDDVESSSMAFRILNRHHRVRLSPNEFNHSVLPGETNLMAIANRKRTFIVAIQQQDGFYLALCPLNELKNSIESGQSSSSPFIPFQFRTPIELAGTPCNLKVALNDERLLVGLLDGSILVFDVEKLLVDQSRSAPLFTIPTKSLNPVKTILPNLGDTPELVAILHSPSSEQQGHQVEIFNIDSCKTLVTWRGEDGTNLAPVSISWSPKGKQVAIGLQSGGLLLYNPHNPNIPRNYITRPSCISEEASSLLSVTWVATNTFYMIFSSLESCLPSFDRSTTSSVAKTHIILAYDSKARTAIDIEISDPTPPFGASFPPGPLCCVLKNWTPTKFFLVCGDGPSTDIGAIGSTSGENWSRFTFEETSTPSLPLGEHSEDMALLGFDIDFTNDKAVRVSEQSDDDTPDLPPAPILYAYMGDGSIVGWHILFLDGTPFPGMLAKNENLVTAPISGPASQLPQSTAYPKDVPSTTTVKETETSGHQTRSEFGSSTSPTTQIASGFAGGGFGKPPAPVFGITGWGFGSKPSPPSSNSAGFGNAVPSKSGFSGFAQSKPSSFGTPLGASKPSVFGQTPGLNESPPPSPPMGGSPVDSPTLENIDLLSSQPAEHGTAGVTVANSKPMSSFIKPGSGAFGFSSSGISAFTPSAKSAEAPAFGTAIKTPPASSTLFSNRQTQPVFGVSGFGTKPVIPTFAASGLGTIPTFGVSGLGQTPSVATKPEPSKPLSGGFGAFAGGGFASFAKPTQPSSFDSLLRQSDKSTDLSVHSSTVPESRSGAVLEGASLMSALALTPSSTVSESRSGTGTSLMSALTLTPEAEVIKEEQHEKADEKKSSLISGTSSPDLPSDLTVFEAVKPTRTPGHKETQHLATEEPKPLKPTVQKSEPARTDRINVGLPNEPLPNKATQANALEVPSVTTIPKTSVSFSGASSFNSIANAPQPPQMPGFGVGLGRPSSRPARSSPLASTPITLADAEAVIVPVPQEASVAKIPASPSFASFQTGLFSQKPETHNQVLKAETSQQPLFGAVGSKTFNAPPSSAATPKSNAESFKFNEPQAANMHPLQVEFTRAYEEVCNELNDLDKRLESLRTLFPAIQTPRGLEQMVQNNNNFVPGKYSFGDLEPFKGLMSRLHETVKVLLEEGKSDKLRLTEVQNLALISETKREELSRWVKAKQDPEFAKTLKSKSLGPEHTENQIRMRKLLQITMTRLQQCEDTMQALQKKLNQDKMGKAVFQAPTLDTIDRTCRNLKVALDERSKIVEKLVERVKSIPSPSRTRAVDSNSSSNSPAPVPSVNIAVAALNSERSCLSLKNALLNARQRPLFTEKVTRICPAEKPRPSDAIPNPSWNFPPTAGVSTLTTSTNPSNGHDSIDRRRQSRKHVSMAVPLRSSTEKEFRAPATSFEWGPLPVITTTAPKKLPFEFKSSMKDSA